MSIETAAIVDPSDEGFDSARQAWNLALEQRPQLVAYPEDEREVAAAIREARERGLRIAPQRTGHNAGPIDWERPAMLLRTDGLKGVEIDAANRMARVNAGALWLDMIDDLSAMGLSALHGSARDIGIAGYSLGGGVGWQARKRGMQTNAVTAIELVTADGELIRTDHDNEPELFWALRGGGGNFGVVTALEFELYPLSAIYAGALFFPLERGDEVLHAWHRWTAGLPDEMTSVGRLLRVPDIPEVPEIVRGQSFSLVEVAFLGTEADGAELMRPLRELGPSMDTVAMVPPVALSYLHMDPEEPVPYASDTLMTGELPAEAIDAVVAASGAGSGSRIESVELRHIGGALARSAPHHGARDKLDGEYLMFAVGDATEAGAVERIEAEAARVVDALAPYASGSDYLNFVETPSYDTSRAFSAEAWERLKRVKAQLDPDGLFLANHEIPS